MPKKRGRGSSLEKGKEEARPCGRGVGGENGAGFEGVNLLNIISSRARKKPSLKKKKGG